MNNKTIIKVKNRGMFATLKNNAGILVVLLFLCILLTFLTDKFFTANNILSVLRQISINMYIAIGMSLVIILGGIDLSVGKIVAMTGTLTVGFIVTQGMPIWAAIILGLLIGTTTGFLSGLFIAKFNVPAFIVTMAMMNITNGVAYVYSGGRSTRIQESFFVNIGTGYLFNVIPLPIVYMLILIIIFSFLLNKTKFGAYIYAIGGNRESARLSGVPIFKVEVLIYTISGFLSAFAGIVLSSRMYSGQPSVGSGYELDAIAACVLGGISMSGGKGLLSGTVIGAMVIGIISNGLNLLGVSSFWQLIVKGIIILIAILIDTQKGGNGILRSFIKNNNKRAH
ncbi:MAG: ABC transporter permease [Treponema sp.]|uniref:ABC transporter permease n=1 Tax=Treponema sp. TaxID=166 RepID=UPI0036088568